MLEISTDQIVQRVMKRAKDLKISPRKVSIEAGYGPDLIRDWKRPKSPLPRIDSLRKVADVLNVPAGWLAFGEGDNHLRLQEDVRSVPIVSWTAAGQFAEAPSAMETIDEGETIDVRGLGRGKFFGLKIKGDSMNRIAPEGSIIVVNANDRNLVSRRFFVFLNNHGTTFKRYMADPDRLEPYSYNTDYETIPINEETSVIGRATRVLSDVEI